MYNFTDYFPMMAANRDKSHHGKNLIVNYNIIGWLCQNLCTSVADKDYQEYNRYKSNVHEHKKCWQYFQQSVV